MALVDLTSVTTGSIGTNTNFIVEENKVLKRISQSSLLKTSAISTTQVNSTTNVPSSSLVYSMNQSINKLNSDLGYNYSYDGVKTFNEVYSNMSLQSTILFEIAGGSTIANELNYPNHSDFGAIIFAWKVRTWRGGAIAIPLDGWANTPIYIGMISGEANNFKWKELALNDDLPVFTTITIDPEGNDYVDIPISGITASWVPIVLNADTRAWAGYVKGCAVASETIHVLLSEQRSGGIRLNIAYMKPSN